MAKVRVYELAKELGVESKALMAKLNELGEFVRSASSTIEPPVVRKLRDIYPAGAAPAPKPAKAAAPARPAAPAAAAPQAPAADEAPAAPASAAPAPAAPAPAAPAAPAGVACGLEEAAPLANEEEQRHEGGAVEATPTAADATPVVPCPGAGEATASVPAVKASPRTRRR